MSLIGPRPELLQYVNQYTGDMWDRSDQNADWRLSRRTDRAAVDWWDLCALYRLFPAADTIQNRCTYLQKYPWLLPAAWVHRLVKTRGRFHDHTMEARGILSANKEAVQKLSRVYEAIGL